MTLTYDTFLTSDAFLTGFGVVVIGLLVILLVLKEMMCAWGGPRAGMWGKVVNVAIIPLLLVFGLIIIMRLVVLL